MSERGREREKGRERGKKKQREREINIQLKSFLSDSNPKEV